MADAHIWHAISRLADSVTFLNTKRRHNESNYDKNSDEMDHNVHEVQIVDTDKLTKLTFVYDNLMKTKTTFWEVTKFDARNLQIIGNGDVYSRAASAFVPKNFTISISSEGTILLTFVSNTGENNVFPLQSEADVINLLNIRYNSS